MVATEIHPNEKILLPQGEAAQLLSVCPETLRKLTQPRGPLPCVRVGNSVRYARAVLEAWALGRLDELTPTIPA